MNNEISKEEIETMVNNIQQGGFNYEQLMFLAGQTDVINSTKTKDMLDEVIENFKEVDSNRDGKVSSDEIKAYFVNKEIDDKKEELTAFKESDITTFYVTENNSTSNDNDETSAIANEGL
jgi:Ca2+-binding EF-hand superfamily protein